MRKWLLCWLLVGLTIFMAACEEAPAGNQSGEAQGAEIMSAPTRTVKPIVSFTPRFTATPIPSATFTSAYRYNRTADCHADAYALSNSHRRGRHSLD